MVVALDQRVVKVHSRQGVEDQPGKSKSLLSTTSLATWFINCTPGEVNKGKCRCKLSTTSMPTWLGVVDKGESRSWKTCQGDISYGLSSDVVYSRQQQLEENSKFKIQNSKFIHSPSPIQVCSLFTID